MKIKKYLLSFLLVSVFASSSCSLEFYSPDQNDEETTAPAITNENATVINPSNYNGSIKYANSNQTELTSEEIYNLRLNSTVYVIASNLEAASLGSGVFFSEDTSSDGYAYLFTNAHVVQDATSIEIVYSNYKRDTATLIGYNLLEDVAVLAVKKNNNYSIPTLNDRVNLDVASNVLAIGTPLSTDYNFVATKGILSKIDSPVSSTYDDTYTLFLLQIDATLNSGNSGGPLFDKYGNLIGLNTMKIIYDQSYTAVDDFNFAIPIDRAVFIADKIFNNIEYKKGSIGITIMDIVDISIAQREEKNITLDYGLYVEEISNDSEGYNKIQHGDIITKINNKSFTNKISFQKELYNFSKGEKIILTIYRNNNYQDITITLK